MKQLSVFVENKLGSIAKVTGALKNANINIRALASFDSPAYGILRVVVDKPEEAMLLLHENQFAAKLTDVLAFELQDAPGALDAALNCLTEAGISINYIYSFVLRTQKEPLMVMHVSDMDCAKKALTQAGIQVVE